MTDRRRAELAATPVTSRAARAELGRGAPVIHANRDSELLRRQSDLVNAVGRSADVPLDAHVENLAIGADQEPIVIVRTHPPTVASRCDTLVSASHQPRNEAAGLPFACPAASMGSAHAVVADVRPVAAMGEDREHA